jgi:hypothetical protein
LHCLLKGVLVPLGDDEGVVDGEHDKALLTERDVCIQGSLRSLVVSAISFKRRKVNIPALHRQLADGMG